MQRAADDALDACRNLLALPHSFTGTVRFDPLRKPTTGDEEEITVRCGCHNGLELLQLDKHSVLKHGEKQLVSAEGGPWTLPQGESPYCPFTPVALARFLGTATIDAYSASDL